MSGLSAVRMTNETHQCRRISLHCPGKLFSIVSCVMTMVCRPKAVTVAAIGRHGSIPNGDPKLPYI